jgi:ligand-binding sensor domain-containing protein
VLCCAWSASAQIHAIKHFGLDRTVFPSRIECIEQRHNGNLLVGTLAGLVEYDGYTFKTIGVADGLAESSVSCLSSIGRTVWVGHWTGNLTRIVAGRDTFETFDLAEAMEFASIKKLVPVDDAVYVLNETGKVFLLDSAGLERLLLPIPEGSPVIDLWRWKQKLMVAVENGVLTMDLSSTSETPTWQWQIETPTMSLRFVYEWSEGLLLAQSTDEWYVFKQHTDGSTSKKKVDLPDATIEAASVDLYGNIWLSTRSQGVLKYNPATDELMHIKRSNGLSYDETRSVFVDREGVVWMATAAGLDQYLGEAFKRFDRSFGLPENMVWDVLALKEELFVATAQGWIKYEWDDAFDIKSVGTIGLEGKEVYQLCGDQLRTLYAITDDGELWRYDAQSDVLNEVTALDGPARCIAMVNGYLWVGTDDGIVVMDPKTNTMLEKLTTQTGLTGNRISGIYYSAFTNETWVSALGSDLVRFKDGKFKRFPLRDDAAPNVIMDAAFDQRGQLWVATYDDGVYRMEDDHFVRLQGKTDIELTSCFALTIDEKGTIWMGNNGSVASYNPALDEYQLFSENDGFMGVEVNPGAMINHPRTGIWMGTLMGLVQFDPDGLQPNPFEPTLHVTKAFLGAKDLLTAKRSSTTFGENNDLTIQFFGTSLMNPEKNRFYYRLKGLHENWRSMDQPEPITYHALPVGSFQFELKACNNSGVCTSSFQVLPFDITPPFYRTWWFYTFLFVVIVFVIFFMDRYRSVALLEDKLRLSELIEQKEQAYIELDQRTQELIAERKVDQRYIEVLQRFRAEREQPVEEVLNDFKAYYQSARKGFSVNSKSVRTIRMADCDVVLVLDTGVDGAAAEAVSTELYLALRRELQPGMSADDVLARWSGCLKGMESHLKGLRTVDWLLCVQKRDRRWLAFDGMVVHMENNGHVIPLESRNSSGGMHADIPETARVFCIPIRTFEQLNEAGTKTFGEERFLETLQKNMGKESIEVAEHFIASFNRWKGAMEQFDDLALFIWKNKTL